MAEETTVEKTLAKRRNKRYLNELEEQTTSLADGEFARFECVMERRCYPAALAIVVPIGAAPAQPTNPRSRC